MNVRSIASRDHHRKQNCGINILKQPSKDERKAVFETRKFATTTPQSIRDGRRAAQVRCHKAPLQYPPLFGFPNAAFLVQGAQVTHSLPKMSSRILVVSHMTSMSLTPKSCAHLPHSVLARHGKFAPRVLVCGNWTNTSFDRTRLCSDFGGLLLEQTFGWHSAVFTP